MFDPKIIILFTLMFFNAIEMAQIEADVVRTPLFVEPDLSNPLIPSEWNQLCGIGYTKIKRIAFGEKCYKYKFESLVTTIYNPNRMTTKSRVFPNGPQSRILGGKGSPLGEAPWAVQLVKTRINLIEKRNHVLKCGGVLLTMKHILTAAHCLEKFKNKRKKRAVGGIAIGFDSDHFVVYAGSDKIFEGWATDKFTTFQHPKYNLGKDSAGKDKRDSNFDIGIIELDKPIQYSINNIKEPGTHQPKVILTTICLPKKNPNMKDDTQKGAVFGWGQTGRDKFPDTLQRGVVTVRYTPGNAYFEIEHFEPPIPCPGDSGAGLVQYTDEVKHRAVLIGIVIKGKQRRHDQACAEESLGEGKAIRVDNHLDWIYERIKG